MTRLSTVKSSHVFGPTLLPLYFFTQTLYLLYCLTLIVPFEFMTSFIWLMILCLSFIPVHLMKTFNATEPNQPFLFRPSCVFFLTPPLTVLHHFICLFASVFSSACSTTLIFHSFSSSALFSSFWSVFCHKRINWRNTDRD